MIRIFQHARNWLPVTLLILFTMGIAATFAGGVHGQTVNEKIGTMEGQLQGLQRGFDSVPEQISALRERMVKVESLTNDNEKKLDMVLGGVWSIVVAVFGILINEIAKRFKLPGSESSLEVRTIK